MAAPVYLAIDLRASTDAEMDRQVLIHIGVPNNAGQNHQPFYRRGVAPRGYDDLRFERVILQSRGIEPDTLHKERRAQLSRLRVGRTDSLKTLIPEGSRDGLEEIITYNVPTGGLIFVTDCYDRGTENTMYVLNLLSTLYPDGHFTKRYHHIQKKVTGKGRDLFHRDHVFSLTVIPR